MSISPFPSRAAIGRGQLVDGSVVDILMTPEFSRMLTDVLTRIGGQNGTSTDDLAILSSFSAEIPGTIQESALNAVNTVTDPLAQIAEMNKKINELQTAVDSLANVSATVAETRKYAQDLEVSYLFAQPASVDWANPGKIGEKTPNFAKFTTLSVTDQITSTLATGTAPLIVASTTNVANLNASSLNGATFAAPGTIGSTTPSAATFTNIVATGSIRARNSLWADRATTAGNAILNFSTTDVYDWQIYTEAGASPALIYSVNGVGEAARWSAARNLMLGTVTDGMTAGGSLAVAKDFAHRGTKVGLFNTVPATKQTIIGSRGANAALASLLTLGALNGFWIDGTAI